MANDVIVTVISFCLSVRLNYLVVFYLLSIMFIFFLCVSQQRVLVMLFPGRHLKLFVWTLNTIFNCLRLKTGVSEAMHE